MEKFVITCQLPVNKLDESGNWLIEDGKPIYETDENGNVKYSENYFCGFQQLARDLEGIEWDTDLNFALLFESRSKAKQVSKKIETGEPITIRELTEQDFLTLKK